MKSRKELKIAGIQFNISWENREENLQKVFQQLEHTKDADIVVLPEMFSTGFSMTAHHLAYDFTSPDLQKLQEWADDKNVAITGSCWFKDGEQYFNRLLWISPKEKIQYYDKRHLFSLTNEAEHLDSGSKRTIVHFKGWNIALMVCYDLRFSVWSKHSAEFQYDILLYVANWPERRIHAWTQLLLARAIENQAYVIGINRVGDDGNNIAHNGASTIIDPMGEVLVKATEFQEQIIWATLSSDHLSFLRSKFPFLEDGDDFQLLGL